MPAIVWDILVSTGLECPSSSHSVAVFLISDCISPAYQMNNPLHAADEHKRGGKDCNTVPTFLQAHGMVSVDRVTVLETCR